MISLKINKLSIFIFLIATGLFFSCSKNKENSTNLSVTIEPQRYFLEQIVGDKYTVTSLVPEGVNPESFDPAPSQMVALANSKAYFKIGFLGIENTLVDKVQNESKLNIIDCSKGIDIIAEAHDHHDEEHGHYHSHAGGDPHYWSSITSAKVTMSNMLDAMKRIDPENEIVYTNNYQEEITRINDTDSIIENIFSKASTKSFVIYHPSLSYFAREYGLEQLSIEHEGKNPAPAQLKKLIDQAKEKGVKAVLVQQEFDIKNAEIIAEQIGAKTYPINLLSYQWHDEMIKIAKAIAAQDE